MEYERLIRLIEIKHVGSFKNTLSFLGKLQNFNPEKALKKYGELGVKALQEATPKDTGYTASCWDYKIIRKNNGVSLIWTNSNVVNGVPIAIIIQYGHATRNGGYVTGIDYINPALKPVFERISKEIWKEVRS